MDWNLYSRLAMSFSFLGKDIDPLMYGCLGLAGEAGEVCDKVKKIVRDRTKSTVDTHFTEEEKLEIAKELGDILWFVNLLANTLGYEDLEAIAQMNIVKINGRRCRGTAGGSGDSR